MSTSSQNHHICTTTLLLMGPNSIRWTTSVTLVAICLQMAVLIRRFTCRISKASRLFGRLQSRVWRARGISSKTKIAVYRAIVLPSLLYGCETWTCYRRHLRQLDQFHLRCLRKILGISWEERLTNQDVLRRANLTGIEAMIIAAQLRWSGHVMRMHDNSIPKQNILLRTRGWKETTRWSNQALQRQPQAVVTPM